MATVVVVQSDELAAWIGVAGVAVGVVLTAGIDSRRARKAESLRVRRDLIRAGHDLAASVSALDSVVKGASDAHAEGIDRESRPLWIEIIHSRMEATREAMQVIAGIGSPELNQAARRLARVAAKPVRAAGEAAAVERDQEVNEALAEFLAVARKVKL